jgi:hypothetical protein
MLRGLAIFTPSGDRSTAFEIARNYSGLRALTNAQGKTATAPIGVFSYVFSGGTKQAPYDVNLPRFHEENAGRETKGQRDGASSRKEEGRRKNIVK